MSRQPVLKFVCTWKGLSNLAFGVGLLAAPVAILGLYGLNLEPGGVLLARMMGAACLGVGMIQFFGRNSRPSDLQSLVVAAVSISDACGLVVSVLAMQAGLMNPLGWSVPALYAFASFGFGLAWFKECRGAAAVAPAV